ncbi:MAG: hypothetical protein JST00_02745 [Deltaproteobacteria bacterium]|nr:hypothetical protein [Deltaproteobacteria bacterium]
MSVANGAKLPNDGVIQIAFDRYLLPSTITRQSFVLTEANGTPLATEEAAIPQYDPIARTVTLRPPKVPWLKEGVAYKLTLPVAKGDSDDAGVRAIDRAALFEDQPREFAFLVGPPTGQTFEPTVSFCRDVLPIFYAKCSVPTCHGTGDSAAASLVLDTSAGVAATALNRVAQGANTGPLSGSGRSPGRIFGVDMPLVDPENPGNSWLLYKIELARPPVVDAGPKPAFACSAGVREPQVRFAFSPLVPQAQRSADEIERAILDDYVLGREMPFPVPQVGGYSDQALTFEEREIVRLWIQGLRRGSAIPDCGGCGTLKESDAGASDAGTGDAGASDAADQ